jgi:hypothetical protein
MMFVSNSCDSHWRYTDWYRGQNDTQPAYLWDNHPTIGNYSDWINSMGEKFGVNTSFWEKFIIDSVNAVPGLPKTPCSLNKDSQSITCGNVMRHDEYKIQFQFIQAFSVCEQAIWAAKVAPLTLLCAFTSSLFVLKMLLSFWHPTVSAPLMIVTVVVPLLFSWIIWSLVVLL